MDEWLPLTHASWSEMRRFGPEPRSPLPVLLRALLADPQARFDELFPDIIESVFHQNTITSAAYATFPYLVEALQALPHPNRQAMVALAQISLAPPPEDVGLPPGPMRAMHSALTTMEKVAVSMLTQPPPHAHGLYYTAVSAVAFARHCCGRLLSDLLEVDGNDRAWTMVTCPQCATATKVTLFDQGAVAWRSQVEPARPLPPRPIARLQQFHATEREPNPWRALSELVRQAAASVPSDTGEQQQISAAVEVCSRGVSADFPPGPVFALLGALFVARGYREQAIRFFRFADEIECPSCISRVRVADAWWGCSRSIA